MPQIKNPNKLIVAPLNNSFLRPSLVFKLPPSQAKIAVVQTSADKGIAIPISAGKLKIGS